MSVRRFLWAAAKNALHPFRGLIGWYLRGRHTRFDRRTGVCTTGKVSLQELGLTGERSVRYEATPIRFFHSVIARLNIDYQSTVFIDFGSGKGRMLLLASHYPFRAIIGVEISRALCQIAIANSERYRAQHSGSPPISVICGGIEEFEYDCCGAADDLLIYMYNPCTAVVLVPALEKLGRLVATRGASITIIYLNPTCRRLMTSASWLREAACGETFDELGNCFMPYVVYRSLPFPWKEASEQLVFQFGPWTMGKWTFSSISNMTSPLAPQTSPPKAPIAAAPTVYQQLRDHGTISRTLSVDRNAIRYVAYRGKRYFIDLSGRDLRQFLEKFSAKTRNTLKRKMRHFAQSAGGTIDLRRYRSPEEMAEFCVYATTVSRVSYQAKIGFGFPETTEFRQHLIAEAHDGRVCGFVLMHRERPVSFVFCRIDDQTLIYTIPGYDPDFTALSPGTVLLVAMIENLLADGRFRTFDFGGQAWDYKALFATGSVDYLRVIWFPLTAKNLLLVILHYCVQHAWRGAAWAKAAYRNGRASAARLWSRRSAPPAATASVKDARASGTR